MENNTLFMILMFGLLSLIVVLFNAWWIVAIVMIYKIIKVCVTHRRK